MLKNQFPKEVYVTIETDGDEDDPYYLNAHETFDGGVGTEPVKVATYRLVEVAEARLVVTRKVTSKKVK